MKPRVTQLVGLSLFFLVIAAVAVGARPGRGSLAVLSPDVRGAVERTNGEPVKVWIYFDDHGEQDADDMRTLLAGVKLTSRSLERRARRSHLQPVDAHDLPICADYLDAVRSLGCRIRHSSKYLNAVSAFATPEQILRLSHVSFVTKIERVHTARRKLPDVFQFPSTMSGEDGQRGATNGNGFRRRATGDSTSYGLSDFQNRQINVPPLHEAGLHGEGVLIAMLDTGFRRIHDAVSHVNVVAEWDFINNDSLTSDEPGDPAYQDMHGSLSLGTIAAFMPGYLIGPAWAADYALAKTERFNRELMLEEDDFVRALEWADSLGADIVSSSLGYFTWYTYPDMDGDTAVTTRAADIAASRGILVVTAAGNEGPLPWPGIIAPADGDSVIAVGAADSLGEVMPFSSRGPTYDGRIKPDVLAMGELVASIRWYEHTGPWPFGGTSGATPLVAGACALILQMNPDWSPIEVREALWSTASHADHPDNDFGWGVIDAFAAAHARSTRTVAFDILPGSCRNPFNPASRGLVPAVLFGSNDLDVRDIDPSSLRLLDRAAPVKNKIADHGAGSVGDPGGCSKTAPDGIADLMLHFAAADIAGALPAVCKREVVTLELTGNMFDGTRIEGETAVTIVGGGDGPGNTPTSRDEARVTKLGDAMPNPFNPTTRISYSLASDDFVQLSIYDVRGHLVERLIDGREHAGDHVVKWDARRSPSGVYFYRLKAGAFVSTRKLVVLK